MLRHLEREDWHNKKYPQLGTRCTHGASQPGVSLSPVSVCSSLSSHSPSHPSKNHQLSRQLRYTESPGDPLLPIKTRHLKPGITAALAGRDLEDNKEHLGLHRVRV